MDERSKRAQMERKRRIRRKKQRRRVLISALVESFDSGSVGFGVLLG